MNTIDSDYDFSDSRLLLVGVSLVGAHELFLHSSHVPQVFDEVPVPRPSKCIDNLRSTVNNLDTATVMPLPFIALYVIIGNN